MSNLREGLLEIRSKWRGKKIITEAENGSRNIPPNLISLTISKLFGLSIKARKIKLKKKLSDASMLTVERVP